MNEQDERCKCANCETIFTDDELELMQDNDGDWMRACPCCETDKYLMDID